MFITLDSAGGEAHAGEHAGESRQADVDGVHRDPARIDHACRTARRPTGSIKTEEIINTATIQGIFKDRFRTTGLTPVEARDLALLLRAGALAAPVFKVEDRTIGPSLGQDNIERGFKAVQIGFLAVIVFMAVYYRWFGMIANVALLSNLVFIVALLSLLQASSLTLARHRGHRVDGRYGGRRERAHLRANTRGVIRGEYRPEQYSLRI